MMIIFLVVFASNIKTLKKLSQVFQVSVNVNPCHLLQQTTENSFNV